MFRNEAEIGTITFSEGGSQLLTFHYGKGNNFAYLELDERDKPGSCAKGSTPTFLGQPADEFFRVVGLDTRET